LFVIIDAQKFAVTLLRGHFCAETQGSTGQDRGHARMQDYRAYIVDRDGHFHSSTVIEAPDDQAAVEAAKPLVDGHDVEVWQRDRRVAILRHKSK
jgi:hypothetical protein